MKKIPSTRDPGDIAATILRQAREIHAMTKKTSGETSMMLESAGDLIAREAASLSRLSGRPLQQHAKDLRRAGHAIARETELLKQVSFHAPDDLALRLTKVIAIISCQSEEIRGLSGDHEDPSRNSPFLPNRLTTAPEKTDP